jgi:hypothetical protein
MGNSSGEQMEAKHLADPEIYRKGAAESAAVTWACKGRTQAKPMSATNPSSLMAVNTSNPESISSPHLS